MGIRILLLSLTLFFSSNCDSKEKSSRVETLPYYGDASFTPKWHSPGDEVLDSFHQIPPFKLLDQNGAAITEKTFEGKIYVTDFFFTICPGICPKMTANMSILQEAFIDDPDVLLLSHSVTPERDSVPVLKQYAEEHDIDARKWRLATGDREQIYKLGRMDYFVEEDLGLEKTADEFLHTENFVLVDRKRHIRGIYNGLNAASINQLIADVKTVKKETYR